MHRVGPKRSEFFCQNFFKYPPTLIIFDTKSAETIKSYKVHLRFVYFVHTNVLLGVCSVCVNVTLAYASRACVKCCLFPCKN